MRYHFVETQNFTRRWYDIGLSDDDLQALQVYLISNPTAGRMMQGTGGVRKIRWAPEGKGKSGGVRTIYLELALDEEIWLLTVFDKHVQDNLTAEEKKALRQLVGQIKGGLV